MGSLRFMLAIAVVAAHTGAEQDLGFNPGIVAVTVFFLLSGYVMTALITKYYVRPFRPVPFYMDRLARIYPQYFFYALAALILLKLRVIPDEFWMQACTSRWKVVANFLILPMQYDDFGGLYECLLVQPVWSLGLEAHFYLLIPFILAWKARTAVFTGSLVIAVLAYASVIDPIMFGYRLWPGTLFIFLAGSSVYGGNRVLPWIAWLFGLVGFVGTFLFSALAVGFNREVTAGIVVGIPALLLVKDRPRSRVEDFMGDLSYGVFLAHFLVNYILYGAGIKPSAWYRDFLYVALLATASSTVTLTLIERPFLAWRRSLRKISA